MRLTPMVWNALYLLALPILTAMLDLGVTGATLAVLLGLAVFWWQRMAPMLAPPVGPEIQLDTISASHYVEKVRWCLDRLGVAYQEVPNAGALGVFAVGRTVPRLRVRTGAVVSSIGNSADILRYLWGRYGSVEPGAAFLEPGPEALALERQLDRYGVDLQRWVYHQILPDRSLTLHLWGADDPDLPGWQRAAVRLVFPLLKMLIRRSFRLSPRAHQKVLANIEACLTSMEERLSDGRQTLLGGKDSSFVDITLAALSGLWLMPSQYGGGRAEGVRAGIDTLPADMVADGRRWKGQFPRVAAHIERMYREERGVSAAHLSPAG